MCVAACLPQARKLSSRPARQTDQRRAGYQRLDEVTLECERTVGPGLEKDMGRPLFQQVSAEGLERLPGDDGDRLSALAT